VSEKNSRFGIRKIEKIEQTDSIGYNFFFKLNNKPVFIKGGVFTPLDMFDFTNSTARYEQVISNAANANMNLLRVWGGGFYESDDFYDLCDKYGIMVWQDLAFSCNLTLANDLKQYNLNEEISENITRIRSHPSLIMLFCNSDLSSYSDFKANKIFPKLDTIKSDCQSFYSDDLPFIIAERCKIPFYSACSMNNRVKNGLIRDWRVWYDAAPVSVYNENQGGLFIEYGMQSLVDKSTIPLEDEQFTFIPSAADNYQFCKMPWLGNGVNGNKLITDYIQMYYNDPLDYSSTIYLSQLFQANSLKIAIESHRLHKPFCMGTIFWHFNDCWPAITWSVTDYFNNNKPSYYAIKNAFKNIKVIPEKLYGDIRVWAINDSLGTFDGECNITLMDFYGKKLYSKKIKTLIPADQTQILWLINEENLVKSKWTNKLFLYVELLKNGKLADENFLFFSDPRFLDLPVPDISYNVVEDENMNNHIEISSNCFAKNVMLYSDSLIVRFSDNNLEMIPGRTYSISTDFLGRKDELQDKLRIISLIDSY
jgi:beta-mannosidase